MENIRPPPGNELEYHRSVNVSALERSIDHEVWGPMICPMICETFFGAFEREEVTTTNDNHSSISHCLVADMIVAMAGVRTTGTMQGTVQHYTGVAWSYSCCCCALTHYHEWWMDPARDETFCLRNFAPWFLRVEKTKFGTVVLHGNVKKNWGWYFFSLFLLFLRRSLRFLRIRQLWL